MTSIRSKIILIAALLLPPLAALAQTAKTRADLYTQTDTDLASGQAMTAATLRAYMDDILASAWIPLTDGSPILSADLSAAIAAITPASIGAAATAHNQAWSTITATPTTLVGYGITDAATSAQGTLADTATQPGDNISTLTNDAGFITSQTDDQTAAEVSIADAGLLYTATNVEGALAEVKGISDSALQSFTETNDLTAAVTWANIPNANVPSSAVTQHVAAINHDALLNFVANEHIDWTGISAGTIHATNYVDNNTQLSNAQVLTAWETQTGRTVSTDAAKLDGIEALADVTDATNVTAGLVAATAISGPNQATIQTNLAVDPAGTDNSTDVTLAGTPDYITIAGQVITRGQIDLAADVTGILPDAAVASTIARDSEVTNAITTERTATATLTGKTLTAAANVIEADTVVTNANLTGHVTSTGNAAVLGSFTVAQLNTAISDATVATGGGTATGTNTGDQTTITGNAGTATALETARTIGGVSFDGTANIVPQTVQVVDTTDPGTFVALFDSAAGNMQPKTDAGITYNASTGMLASRGLNLRDAADNDLSTEFTTSAASTSTLYKAQFYTNEGVTSGGFDWQAFYNSFPATPDSPDDNRMVLSIYNSTNNGTPVFEWYFLDSGLSTILPDTTRSPLDFALKDGKDLVFLDAIYRATFESPTLTADRAYTPPDASGTIALTSDITAALRPSEINLTASRDLALTDEGAIVRNASASAYTVTVTPQATTTWIEGITVTFRQAGAGTITLAEGSGVTLNTTAGTGLATTEAGGFLVLVRTATSDVWDVY